MAAPRKAEKSEPDEKPQGRVVLGQLVTARTKAGQVLYFHKGDVLPDSITEESLAHLASLGFISE